MKTSSESTQRIHRVPTEKIEVFIDRKRDKAGHSALTKSIREYGLLIPITVVKRRDGKYKLVKGQGRLEAHKKLGVPKIEAFVYEEGELPEDEVIQSWLIENEVRDGLSELDKARLMKMEYEQNSSYEHTAKLFLVKPSTVRQYLSMLKRTSEKVIMMVQQRKISFTQAKELSTAVKTTQAQESVAHLIVRNKLSRREASVVAKRASEIEDTNQKVTIQRLEQDLRNLQAEIRDHKRFLSALEQKYSRLVPHVRALMRDPELVALLSKHDLPQPELE